jgi:GT2 family glycosyltransferase
MVDRYHIPPGVGRVGDGMPILLSTYQGGRIALDRVMFEIWRQADGRSAHEVIAHFREHQAGGAPGSSLSATGGVDLASGVTAALLCLEQAGLLAGDRPVRSQGPHRSESEARVSVIIVSYNSRLWLPGCLDSLAAQTLSPIEVIVVDNASSDGSAEWLETYSTVAGDMPEVRLIRLQQSVSLAQALNLGIAAAHQGDYVLLLNPDVVLEPDALAHMLTVACQDPACAAVAARLKFLWAPAFLNGLGNYVGAFSWGTDSALGHLDLGQFDDWSEIPSACFAAALIPRAMLDQVGLVDEGFPLYYEDSEWCYRARLYGYTVRLASAALIYHAFSGRVPGGDEAGLSAVKLQRVVYGRLRFISKLLSWPYLLRFFTSYLIEDLARCSLALARGRWQIAGAYASAWRDYLRMLPEIRRERRKIQSRRQSSDRALFSLQRMVPMPLIWRGLPLLTWDLVCYHYLPLIADGRAIYFADIEDIAHMNAPRRYFSLARARSILRSEGARGLWYHLGRWLQWQFVRV